MRWYKTWGRGKSWVPENWEDMSREITKDLHRKDRDLILAFDNLGIQQLGLQKKMLKAEWEAFYQGPEFSRSMYVDGVTGLYAPCSISSDKVSWNSITLSEYYVKNHTKTE